MSCSGRKTLTRTSRNFLPSRQNVSSTRSSVKSVGRRFNPSYSVTRCLPSSATNRLRCQPESDQSTLYRFTSSTRVPALGSEMARMRPLGLIALPVAGGSRGLSLLAAQTAIKVATTTSVRMTLPRIHFPKLRISKPQFLNLIRKSDLASVGHALELAAFFPWFLLVPRDLGSAMIVRIADEGGLLLCCA